MSIFSGKNDLFDYISGLGGWFGRDGKPVKLGEANCYYSDETLDFEEFKRQTGGVIHQRKKVTVTVFASIELLASVLRLGIAFGQFAKLEE